MQRLTQVAIDTDHGLRTLELFSGDITKIGYAVDVLCISSFPGGYSPIIGTLIQALENNLGLSVRSERQRCEFDLTGALGIWISRELKGLSFRRIIGAEAHDTASAAKALDHLFSGVAILDALGIDLRTVAMPLLFSGSMGLDPEAIATGLIAATERLLKRSSSVERVLLVEVDAGRVGILANSIDSVLGRANVILPRRPLIEGLKQSILSELLATRGLVPKGHLRLLDEIQTALSQPEVRAVDLGILARRVVEFVMNDLLGEKHTSPDLIQRIDKLSSKGVASWMQSYMHLLRVLGNEEAHEKSTVGKRPPTVQEADLTICLLCMHRLWTFWAEWRGQHDG